MHALLHLSQRYEHSDSTQLQSLVAAAVAFQLVIVRVIVATAWQSYIKRWWLWWWQWMFTQQWCGPRYDAFRGICLNRRWSYNSKREEASLVYKMLITTKGMLSTTVRDSRYVVTFHETICMKRGWWAEFASSYRVASTLGYIVSRIFCKNIALFEIVVLKVHSGDDRLLSWCFVFSNFPFNMECTKYSIGCI